MKNKIIDFLKHFIALVLVLSGIAAYYAFKSEDPQGKLDTIELKAKVLAADNTEVRSNGYSSIGYQELEVKILEGKFAGRVVPAKNSLIGQTELENLFKPDDIIIAAVILKNGTIDYVKAVDLVRQDVLLLIFGFFVVVLLLYAGLIGIKALISFVMTVFIIWEFLVQRILAGANPLLTTTYTLVLLSAVIIFLVAGVNKKGMTAFLGTISGLFITLLLTLVFGSKSGLFGMTQPYVSTLIFSGYYNLDIRQIFYCTIILGASGAAMDIAMDIAASMDEIRNKKPDIRSTELIRSGLSVGRHVIGTMATTLLLAYSGGYLSLLMVFKIKESSVIRMINLKIVAAEIMRTLIGSTGLVLVAPITAVLGGIIMVEIFKTNLVKSDYLPVVPEPSSPQYTQQC